MCDVVPQRKDFNRRAFDLENDSRFMRNLNFYEFYFRNNTRDFPDNNHSNGLKIILIMSILQRD